MNKRDTFAAVAMHALLVREHHRPNGSPHPTDDQQEKIAELAYNMAAKMLNERQGRPDPDDESETADAIRGGLNEIACELENLQELMVSRGHKLEGDN